MEHGVAIRTFPIPFSNIVDTTDANVILENAMNRDRKGGIQGSVSKILSTPSSSALNDAADVNPMRGGSRNTYIETGNKDSGRERGTRDFITESMLSTPSSPFGAMFQDRTVLTSDVDSQRNSGKKRIFQSFISKTFSTPTASTGSRHTTLYDTPVDLKDITAKTVSPSRTLRDQTTSTEVFTTGHYAPFVNESCLDNPDKATILPSNVDQLANDSDFNNKHFYLSHNWNNSCSIIRDMTFVFKLGRKMPLYLDIICLVIGVVGIFGNLATIVVVAINIKFRKPYFLTILSLAVADLMGLLLRIGVIYLEFEFVMYIKCIRPSFYIPISTCTAIEINSILQVVLIAVIKFLLLVCPIKSREYVTNSLIIALFVVIFSVSVSFAFICGYFIMQRVNENEDASPILLGYGITIIFPSTLIIIILHFVKVAKLRKSQGLRKEVETMNKVVTIILGIYMVYNFQKIGRQVLLMVTQNATFLQVLYQSITVSAFVQHASNSVIYMIFTPLVQRPWSRFKERFGSR
jgi:hypothetical protein